MAWVDAVTVVKGKDNANRQMNHFTSASAASYFGRFVLLPGQPLEEKLEGRIVTSGVEGNKANSLAAYPTSLPILKPS